MIYSPPHTEGSSHPSVYDGITGWAAHARQRLLAGIAAAGGVAGVAILATDRSHVAVGGLLLAASAVGVWGLLEQRAATPHSVVIRVAQALSVALGTMAAVLGGLALLFWVMGPAPVL